MKIKITVDLPLDLDENKIIVYSSKTLSMVLGTSSVSGNQHIYNVKRLTNPLRWEIPIDQVEKQINKKEHRIAKEIETVEIMKQIVSMVEAKGKWQKESSLGEILLQGKKPTKTRSRKKK